MVLSIFLFFLEWYALLSLVSIYSSITGSSPCVAAQKQAARRQGWPDTHLVSNDKVRPCQKPPFFSFKI